MNFIKCCCWVFGLSLTGISLVSVFADNPIIVAHRGASYDAPENTLEAFELAWEQGADAIEGDFRLTRDGEIVCIHDKDTGKVGNRNLVVADSSFAELRRLDVGSYHSQAYKGAIIPTLEEVLNIVPEDKKIYIEVKTNPSIVPKLLRIVERSGLHKDQIIVIAFDKEVIREIKEKAPMFKAYWLSGFKQESNGQLNPSVQFVLETLKEIKADGFSSTKDHISKAYVEEIQENGFEYHVWTVDDAEVAKRFVEWGAKSITTNKPGELRLQIMDQSK